MLFARRGAILGFNAWRNKPPAILLRINKPATNSRRVSNEYSIAASKTRPGAQR